MAELGEINDMSGDDNFSYQVSGLSGRKSECSVVEMSGVGERKSECHVGGK